MRAGSDYRSPPRKARNVSGTMNWADVYGEESSPIQMAAPISAGGPNQSFVNPAFSGSGTLGPSTGPAPAFSIVGMIALLIAWRVFVQLNEE